MANGCEPARVRSAPSPTGDPHVGTAYVTLFDYVWARKTGGEFVLRIEDTDRARSTPESEQAIMRALRWAGLAWDEGPDVGGPYAPYRQSERSDIYREHADILVEKGAAYRCFCTPERLTELREQQKEQKGRFGYDGRCRELGQQEVDKNLADGVPFTVRLCVPEDGGTTFEDLARGPITWANDQIDDQVLLKSDGFPTYHLASVVDDHLMRISHVIRAEEWISSTPKHVLLYKAFGWDMPTFIHLPLLRNKDKSKISKRKNPTSLDWYREQGYLPEALLNFLALMGWSMGEDREVFSLQEMIDAFSWDRVKTSGPVFDLQKLDWLNGEHIRALSLEELLGRVLAGNYTRHAGEPAERLLAILALAQERLKKLSEFDALTEFFFTAVDYEAADLIPKKRDGEFVRAALSAIDEVLRGVVQWRSGPLEAAVRALCEQRDWKRGDAYMVLRVAATCRKVSTPLFETMEILGQQECLSRLAQAAERAVGL